MDKLILGLLKIGLICLGLGLVFVIIASLTWDFTLGHINNSPFTQLSMPFISIGLLISFSAGIVQLLLWVFPDKEE